MSMDEMRRMSLDEMRRMSLNEANVIFDKRFEDSRQMFKLKILGEAGEVLISDGMSHGGINKS